MSVSENIGFPLRVRGRSKTEIQREVGELLELMKLVGLGDRKPVQLSGGQQQRVALARALVFRPRLVLMDEPLGALDKQLREHLQLEIKHIQKKLGVSVVYVTHDQSEALTMSDRIAVFDKGSIQQIASPDALYEKPKSAFVAQFIGENNQIPAVIVSIDGDECCVSTSDGCLLRALAVGVGEVGSPAILSIRPERVIVRPPTRSVGNTFSAIVREVIYHGNEFRVRCDAFTGISFSTRVPNVGEPLNISIGDEIKLGCQISNCRAFPVN